MGKLEATLVEKAGPAAMGMLDKMTKGIVPTNKVSVFIEEAIPPLIDFEGSGGVTGLLGKLMVAGSNKDPAESAKRLLVLYNQLGEFFTEVSTPQIEEAEVVEEVEAMPEEEEKN